MHILNYRSIYIYIYMILLIFMLHLKYAKYHIKSGLQNPRSNVRLFKLNTKRYQENHESSLHTLNIKRDMLKLKPGFCTCNYFLPTFTLIAHCIIIRSRAPSYSNNVEYCNQEGEFLSLFSALSVFYYR